MNRPAAVRLLPHILTLPPQLRRPYHLQSARMCSIMNTIDNLFLDFCTTPSQHSGVTRTRCAYTPLLRISSSFPPQLQSYARSSRAPDFSSPRTLMSTLRFVPDISQERLGGTGLGYACLLPPTYCFSPPPFWVLLQLTTTSWDPPMVPTSICYLELSS